MYFQSIENLYLGVMYVKEDITYAQWVHPFFLKGFFWNSNIDALSLVYTLDCQIWGEHCYVFITRHSAVHL